MNSESLHDHYHQPDLTGRILASLRAAEINPDQLTREDLHTVDEFHIRGRAATAELALLADLQAAHTVLDLGCGIGGPARLLAAEYGCRVTGLDLVQAYCDVATELTRRVGLAEKVDFRQGDLREMPFDDNSFDRVWSQHTTMNIPDKVALATEVKRVLKPGGKAVFYEVCAGSGEPVHLPVPWASESGHSHLVSVDEFRRIMTGAGLRADVWEDVTAVAIDWVNSLADRVGAKPVTTPRRPGLGLLMGPTAGDKGRNLALNLREHRIAVIWGVYSV